MLRENVQTSREVKARAYLTCLDMEKGQYKTASSTHDYRKLVVCIIGLYWQEMAGLQVKANCRDGRIVQVNDLQVKQ